MISELTNPSHCGAASPAMLESVISSQRHDSYVRWLITILVKVSDLRASCFTQCGALDMSLTVRVCGESLVAVCTLIIGQNAASFEKSASQVTRSALFLPLHFACSFQAI